MKKNNIFLLASALLLTSCGGGGSSSSSSSASSSSSSEAGDVITLAEAKGEVIPYSGNLTTGASYEIFVYSFADSDGDGIGDLKGIEDKLDYLSELGVENLWLTPIHPSTTYHKYNVRDYYDIDPAFGTVDDFVSLCQKAKAKGINVFMDMVFNHSGLDNPMFNQACQDLLDGKTGEDSLADLYCISLNDKDIKNTKGSYHYGGEMIWYECNFDRSMPEFNLDSNAAKKLHKDVMQFWLNKGASGFRFDGVAYYYYGLDEDCMKYVKYLSETAKSLKNDCYLVAEYWVSSQLYLNEVPANGMTAFNFSTADTVTNSVLRACTSGIGYDYARTVQSADQGYRTKSDGKILPSIFISNHDQDRWASKKDDSYIRLAAAMYLLTPGTPYLYYGEEIKLEGIRMQRATDANRRLAMQWVSNKEQDTARCTRIESESDYNRTQTSLGALEAIKDENSVTAFYKKLLHFRAEHPEIQKGCYRNITPKDSQVCAFQIDYGNDTYRLVHNTYTDPLKVAMEGYEPISGYGLGETALTNGVLSLGSRASILLKKSA